MLFIRLQIIKFEAVILFLNLPAFNFLTFLSATKNLISILLDNLRQRLR